MEKKETRKLIFQRRKEQTDTDLRKNSQVICEKIMNTEAFQTARCVYAYMDCKGEVCMRELLETAWRMGKRTAVPKVFGEDLRFFYISSYEDVERGYFDVPEPITVTLAKEEDALVIVPGVAFDAKRHRCGYGKGFYDRYLSVHKKHETLSPAFDFQIIEDVPSDAHDILPQALFTETHIYK